MACLNKNCKIKSDERMITCWLCHENCHLKCSDISGLVADAISNNKGLHWCCVDCRKIGVSFYRFFQSQKQTFLQILEDSAKLSNRINDYGKLFENYKLLENMNSPQSSPKRRKSARNANKEKRSENNYSTSLSNTPSVPMLDSTSNNSSPIPNLPSSNPSTSNNPISSYSTSVNDVPPTRLERLTNHDPESVVNPSSPYNVTPVEVILTAVPPKRSIFISRLPADTTTETIDRYIISKIGKFNDINIHKFNFSQQRSIASFKITTSDEMYSRLIDPEFWPKHTIVREYIYRERQMPDNNGYIHQNSVNFSKN